MQLSVLVHDPSHHLRIRARVWRRDVPRRSQDACDLVHERPCDQLQLVLVQIPRRAVDSALGAAERDVCDRRLPRHQRRQRANLVEVHSLVIPDAAFERAARAVVLHPVSGEHVKPFVAEPHRNLHLNLAVGSLNDGPQVVGQPQAIGRGIEVVRDGVEARGLGGTDMRRAVRHPR